MSLERILEILWSLGLSSVESRVYVYLAKAGPSKAKDLTVRLGMPKRQLCIILRKLEVKEIVTIKPESSVLYSALPFSELLNKHIKSNLEQAKKIRETKRELLDSWQKMHKQGNV